MAITRGATVTANQNTDDVSGQTFSHTVDSGTTLLVLEITLRAAEVLASAPTWNTSETLSLIHATTTVGGTNGDCRVHTYGLLNPTATTANIVVAYDTTTNPSTVTAINYLGTATASIEAATNVLSEDVNEGSGTSTSVHAEAGTDGNALLFAGFIVGADGGPASNDASFNELVDAETGGASATADSWCYVADLLTGLPSAITVTWAVADNNASSLIEIVAASGTPPAFDTVPAVQDTTTTQIDLTATADADSTWYAVATIRGSTTPSVAQVKAGQNGAGAAALADDSVALTGTVQGSLSLTGLSSAVHPLVDIHSVVTNAGGDSAVASLSGVFLDAPTGTVFVTAALRAITAATQAADCEITSTGHGVETGQLTRIYGVVGMTELNSTGNESPDPDDGLLYWQFTSTGDDTGTLGVNSTGFTGYVSGGSFPLGFSLYADANPVVVNGDVIKVDQVTVENSFPITFNPDGTISIDTGNPDDTTFDWWTLRHYDVSGGAYEAASVFSRFEDAPVLISAFDDPVEVWQNVAFSLPITGNHIEHPNDLAMTGSLADGPSDIAFDNDDQDIQGTTTDTPGTFAVTLTMTSPTGLADDFEFNILVVETAQMPDVDNGDVTQAAAITAITGAGLSTPQVFSIRSPSVDIGNVVAQYPAAGAYFPIDGEGYSPIIFVSSIISAKVGIGTGMGRMGLR